MKTSKIIKLVIVDDHEIMRDGLRFMMLAFDDIELVGEARSGEESVEVCQLSKPDVVLVDMKMSGMDGIATTRRLKQNHPDMRILILTTYHESELVQQAVRAGAIGYLLKDASKDDVAEAIRSAHRNRMTFCSEVAADLVHNPAEEALQIGHDLTAREREVLIYLARGLRNNEIADQLHRSPFTIRHHVSSIIAKLGASNRSKAVVIALKNRLVE